MTEYKAIDKANLQVALSANNKKVLEHIDNADSTLREDLNIFSKYQRYVNTELDYGVFEITSMTITDTTPIVFSNVVSGNLELSENGYIILKKDKTYILHCNLYNTVYTTGIIMVDSNLNQLAEPVTSATGSFIYKTTDDIEITFITEQSVDNVLEHEWSCVNVHEINRQITIDPVNYVDETQGLDDTPIGNIISYMGNSVPTHYLICDGTEYNILDYPQLANHILNEFGSYNYFGGDGELTFCVPDLRGEFLRGSGTATRNTGSGGEVGEHQDPTKNDFYGNVLPQNTDTINTNSSKESEMLISANSIDDTSETIYTSRPTNTAVLYCIKYESTYYMAVTKTATQEEVDLLKEEIELLKQEISQLSDILDEINGTEV